MGQKVNPLGFRLGITRTWDSTWFAHEDFTGLLHEDINIRKYIKDALGRAGISRVEIERAANQVRITIHAARPGIVIGRGGAEIKKLHGNLEKMCTNKTVRVKVQEVGKPDLVAQLVAESMATQLSRRVSFRRAMRQAIYRAKQAGAKGAKVAISGRISGSEIARTEHHHEGRVPLHTLRADIDYGFTEAKTTYGNLGVKVWIFKEELIGDRTASVAAAKNVGNGETGAREPDVDA